MEHCQPAVRWFTPKKWVFFISSCWLLTEGILVRKNSWNESAWGHPSDDVTSLAGLVSSLALPLCIPVAIMLLKIGATLHRNQGWYFWGWWSHQPTRHLQLCVWDTSIDEMFGTAGCLRMICYCKWELRDTILNTGDVDDVKHGHATTNRNGELAMNQPRPLGWFPWNW